MVDSNMRDGRWPGREGLEPSKFLRGRGHVVVEPQRWLGSSTLCDTLVLDPGGFVRDRLALHLEHVIGES